MSRYLPHLLALFFLPLAFGAPLSAQEAAEEVSIDELVEQLGADSYNDREAANAELKQIGAKALPALKQGSQAFDREIRQRCRRLLSEIAQSDLQQRIEAFLADTNSDNDYGLPFWSEFCKEYGDGKVTRQLFVEMQQQESALLQAIVEQPSRTADLIETRSQQIQNYTQQQGRNASLGSVVTLLSVAGVRHEAVSDDTHPRLFHFCHQPEFQAAIETGSRRPMLRQMLGTLVREADNMWSLYYVLDLAMKYDLKEGLPQALAVANNRNSQPHIRQLAILAIGKLGDKSHLPVLEEQFDDTSRTGSHTRDMRVYHQQIRDLALAVACHLREYDLHDIGLELASAHQYMLFQPSTIGFENDVTREAAFDSYLRKRGPQAAGVDQ